MTFSTAGQLSSRQEADLIVIPFWQLSKKKQLEAKPAAVITEFQPLVNQIIGTGDFVGNPGESLCLYTKEGKEKRCLLLGLGKQEEINVEVLRKAYANVVKECQKRNISKINIICPTISELRRISVEECLRGIAEGILLCNYRWEGAPPKEKKTLLRSICLIGVLPQTLNTIKECKEVAEGIYFARDLINGNADLITPSYLAQSALNIAEKFSSVKATVLDAKQIEKEKMGLLLAVARGSAVDPAFIVLSYRGYSQSKEHTVIVGKGVTFDTGGLNLKTSNMHTMRDDMSGAAAALATIATAAALKLKTNVTAVVAATENAIDAKSYKPGDVYTGHADISVEIGDTDAEGRLTLADALSYSVKKLKPTAIIDMATLTGSMVIALGEGMAGLFCNDDNLAADLLESSRRTHEMLWRMPLYSPYNEMLRSDIADLRNTGGRYGGAINAALFLQHFVGNVPWAHIDIAGTAFSAKEQSYVPKNGVGFGVRLMIDYLQNLSKKSK